ncbi:ABC transporter ATP-binding protein [Ligilactobacillus salitolerans]|uniref:ABC transporter ATP-binding protein n=1 Tax=Ligilactobacillus salitolerans TaxID=1808352 RepID=A0A401ISD0_9LACO|nr:ATP-binding cassette domain-containing protein [Ligilactobacillus salitolerans]GBG94417.1 ABC transporter ATP-binding protein [Ligilactobacillus salitolerans]
MTTKTATQPVLELRDVSTVVNRKTPNEAKILRGLNLKIHPGDFITVIGSNGAGKSTLFNTIAGSIFPDQGQILHNGADIGHESVEKRTKFLSRVFQDPKMGTAPRMTVAENLLLAAKRGQKRGLRFRKLRANKERFAQLADSMGNGLAQRLDTPTENLSGGQRQTLSFLMATLNRPDILLLDEHTAALDPKTSASLMQLTAETVTQQNLTCLMITHHMEDALRYGNRLIVLHAGQITLDVRGEEKDKLTQEQVMQMFVD